MALLKDHKVVDLSTMKISFTIPGNTPSKKNSKRVFRNYYSGKMVLAPSKVHEDWYNVAYYDVLKQKNKGKNSGYYGKRAEVEITLYFQDARKRDLTNAAESIMDLLVDLEILKDDNVFEVPRVLLIYGGKVKDNPRATVDIFYLP